MARIVRKTAGGFVVRMKSGKEETFKNDEFDYDSPQVGDDVTVTRDDSECDHVNLNARTEKTAETGSTSNEKPPAPTIPKRVPAKSSAPSSEKTPFWQKTWFLVVMILFFPIVGLVLLFTVFRKRVGIVAKIAITLLTVFYIIIRLTVVTPRSNGGSDASATANESSEQEQPVDASSDSPEAAGEPVPDGYAYIAPTDLQKYGPNMSGANVYTVAAVYRVDEGDIRITLDPDSGFMTSDFKTDTDYSSTVSDGDTVAISGTVSSYNSYGSMGTSIELTDCRVLATGDAAERYSKDASDDSLSQYFTVTSDVASASGDDVSEDQYKSLCTTPDYESVLRNPDEYKDSYVKVTGTVDQVVEGLLDTYTLYIEDANGDKWDVAYYYADGESHVLEGDYITVYGKCNGTSTSTTVLGKQVTMPSVTGKYIDR